MLFYLDYFKIDILIGRIKSFDHRKLEHAVKEIHFNEGICSCQFLDSDRVAGLDHLLFSAINALRAFESGNNISKKLAVEFLLFVSGQRQIKKAISMVGVRPETKSVTVVLMGTENSLLEASFGMLVQLIDGQVEDKFGVPSAEKLRELSRLYEVTSSELESMGFSSHGFDALEKLIIERVALLGIRH